MTFHLMHFLSECEKTKKVKLHFKYLGTLSACLFSLTLFLSLSLLTAITCDPTLLFHDCNYMSTISIWSPIVAIGVLLATFRWVSSTPLGFLSRLLKVSKIRNGLSEDIVCTKIWTKIFFGFCPECWYRLGVLAELSWAQLRNK